MVLKTRLTELLGIRYPIIQAAMSWATDAQFVAAVSNAGGLGTLSANAGASTVTRSPQETGERLRTEIRKTKQLTDKPFAFNLLVPGPKEEEFADEAVKAILEEGVPVVIVSQGGPQVYTQRLKKAGVKVLHFVASAKHAETAERIGVDAVIVVGCEGGGHTGFDLLTSFSLIPEVVDVVKIPVIAGGAVTDARGFVAALVLGADGVYIGTRFVATKECPVHARYKEALVKAEATDTAIIKHGRPSSFEGTRDRTTEYRLGAIRLLLNNYARQLQQLDAERKGPEEIANFYISKPPGYEGKDISRLMVTTVYGDINDGMIPAGQGVGLIKDIPSCEELIRRLVQGAEKSARDIAQTFQK